MWFEKTFVTLKRCTNYKVVVVGLLVPWIFYARTSQIFKLCGFMKAADFIGKFTINFPKVGDINASAKICLNLHERELTNTASLHREPAILKFLFCGFRSLMMSVQLEIISRMEKKL